MEEAAWSPVDAFSHRPLRGIVVTVSTFTDEEVRL